MFSSHLSVRARLVGTRNLVDALMVSSTVRERLRSRAAGAARPLASRHVSITGRWLRGEQVSGGYASDETPRPGSAVSEKIISVSDRLRCKCPPKDTLTTVMRRQRSLVRHVNGHLPRRLGIRTAARSHGRSCVTGACSCAEFPATIDVCAICNSMPMVVRLRAEQPSRKPCHGPNSGAPQPLLESVLGQSRVDPTVTPPPLSSGVSRALPRPVGRVSPRSCARPRLRCSQRFCGSARVVT